MYLSPNGEFKHPEINEILETDKEISDEIYRQFFLYQSQGKQFKVKDITGQTFEEIFEELIPELVPVEPSDIEKLKQENQLLKAQLEQTNADLAAFMDYVLGGV